MIDGLVFTEKPLENDTRHLPDHRPKRMFGRRSLLAMDGVCLAKPHIERASGVNIPNSSFQVGFSKTVPGRLGNPTEFYVSSMQGIQHCLNDQNI